MAETVLITGGTGTIGRRLTQLLQQQGYHVSILSRSARQIPNVTVYQWNIKKGHIDPKAVTSCDHIVHLAGEGVADERWTEARKQEILESRTRSTQLLTDALSASRHPLKSFVSASGIDYYGSDVGDQPMTETSPAGTDFLAQVTRAWERAADQAAALGIRTVKFRIGVVLTPEGGALPKLTQPIRLGVGAPLGSGQQYFSWIHIDDLCNLFIQAINDARWQGVYNAVAPQSVTNAALTRTIAQVLNRPLIMPKIPAFAIKLVFGELAVAVLGSKNILNKRIQDETGFRYQYGELKSALTNLLT